MWRTEKTGRSSSSRSLTSVPEMAVLCLAWLVSFSQVGFPRLVHGNSNEQVTHGGSSTLCFLVKHAGTCGCGILTRSHGTEVSRDLRVTVLDTRPEWQSRLITLWEILDERIFAASQPRNLCLCHCIWPSSCPCSSSASTLCSCYKVHSTGRQWHHCLQWQIWRKWKSQGSVAQFRPCCPPLQQPAELVALQEGWSPAYATQWGEMKRMLSFDCIRRKMQGSHDIIYYLRDSECSGNGEKP